jgi:ribonuclease HI
MREDRMEQPLLTIYTDGASRGNPGDAAFAFIISGAGPAPVEEAGCLGKMTNNQAEYTALVRALRHALKLGRQHRLLVHSDSELMVKQMNGAYRVKNAELLPLYEEARDLADEFAGVQFVHVRREQNKRADALCNEALDGQKAPQPRRPAPAPAAVPVASEDDLSVSDEAVNFLRAVEMAWRRGDEGPSPHETWDQLAAILRRHGVALTAPSGPRKSQRGP